VTGGRVLNVRASGIDYQTLAVDYRGDDGEPASAPEIFGPYTHASNDEIVDRINRWAAVESYGSSTSARLFSPEPDRGNLLT
jgi:hypothetical protein